MPIYVRNKGGSFTPAPMGLHHSVCVDAVDLGMVDGSFGKKHKVELRWQTKEVMEDGKPYLVVKRYGASLHPKATLRADLQSWRGRPFTDDEAAEFDIEKLIGANCQINVVHNVTDSGTYANVVSIVPAPSVLGKLTVSSYERVCARAGYKPPKIEEPEEAAGYDGPQPDDDSIPF